MIIDGAAAQGCTDANLYNVDVGGLNDDPWLSYACSLVDEFGGTYQTFW